MGNSDSKPEEQETVVTTEPGKESERLHPNANASSSLEGSYENGKHQFTEEKKELDTPRTKPKTRDERDDGDNVSSSHITDDQVHVNLAMADLMAYLQVVANNSNHLPLTRRDDPELDRTVSTLTSEDYARKSAAFIPSDVRMIGGTFTRYGRVWDLPTSEEYNAVDGALEPGRSYGGACCNAMLKVLYDAANDAADAAQTQQASQALFDDDDTDEDESTCMGKSFKSGFSLEQAAPNPTTITWADLLRKMKAEVKDIEYAQAPKITTTRKIDLNKPFSLVPDNFDPRHGKKRSLLIGCGYKNIQGAELKASHDDVRSMKDYIVNVHGFSETKGLMTVLMDDDAHKHPTFLNITEALKALSEESQPGDAVFVQFSGHGGRVLDAPIDSEAESYDEVIVPVDYRQSGLIRDTLIFKTLLAPMRYGVTVTIMIDCCDTGMVLELPYSWSTKGDKRDSLAKLSTNEDFSFVRFLKVVKTLYETSTFTQLGRTVGSALGVNPSDAAGRVMQLQSESDIGISSADGDEHGSSMNDTIFDVIAEACNAGQREKAELKLARSRENPGDEVAMQKREPQSLLEQVMNCTLLASPDEEFSEEDTLTEDRSYDESFRSLSTEEEYEARKNRRRSRRRTRKRR